VPVHLERLPGVRYTLHMSDPLSVRSQAGQEELDTIAEQLDDHFSAVIRAHMSDWLQLYYLRV
jgi:lauroyl/myristoyl acyltransferase